MHFKSTLALLLFSCLLLTSVLAQAPTPAPTPSPQLLAERANSRSATHGSASTKTTKETSSKPKTTQSPTSSPSASASASASSAPSSSPTPSPSSTPSPSTLSTGAIAGIAVGVVAFVALFAGMIVLYIWRMRRSRKVHRQSMAVKGTLGGVTPINEEFPAGSTYRGPIENRSSRDPSPSPSSEGRGSYARTRQQGDVEAQTHALGTLGTEVRRGSYMASGPSGRGEGEEERLMAGSSARGPSVEMEGGERPMVLPPVGGQGSPIELSASPTLGASAARKDGEVGYRDV